VCGAPLDEPAVGLVEVELGGVELAVLDGEPPRLGAVLHRARQHDDAERHRLFAQKSAQHWSHSCVCRQADSATSLQRRRITASAKLESHSAWPQTQRSRSSWAAGRSSVTRGCSARCSSSSSRQCASAHVRSRSYTPGAALCATSRPSTAVRRPCSGTSLLPKSLPT